MSTNIIYVDFKRKALQPSIDDLIDQSYQLMRNVYWRLNHGQREKINKQANLLDQARECLKISKHKRNISYCNKVIELMTQVETMRKEKRESSIV